jgi:hypothetical protein
MIETHCWDFATELAAGLAMINQGKHLHKDLHYTSDGIEILFRFKGQDYLVTIQPKGETDEQQRTDQTSVKAGD